MTPSLSAPLTIVPAIECEADILDARHALHRCASDADLAAWARRCGDALLSATFDFKDRAKRPQREWWI